MTMQFASNSMALPPPAPDRGAARNQQAWDSIRRAGQSSRTAVVVVSKFLRQETSSLSSYPSYISLFRRRNEQCL
jgi:hypothetical protein